MSNEDTLITWQLERSGYSDDDKDDDDIDSVSIHNISLYLYICPDLHFTPMFGSVLGGQLVSLKGPCIESNVSVIGRFNQTGNEFCCFLQDEHTKCVTPSVFATGLLNVSLKVANQGWTYNGKFEISEWKCAA